MAAELSRVAARTAFRPTSTLFQSPVTRSSFTYAIAPTCHKGLSTPSVFLRGSNGAKSYSSLSWTNPTRDANKQGQSSSQDDKNIRRPTMAAYETSTQPRRDGESRDEDHSPRIDILLDDVTPGDKAPEPNVVPPPPPIRFSPRLGRTVPVTKTQDVARAFKVLQMQCATNRVKQDERMQRFHERPGLKRKRQRTERWVKKFRKGFSATVKRVQELNKQGW